MPTHRFVASLLTVLLAVVTAVGLCTPKASAVVNGTSVPLADRRFDAIGILMNAGPPPGGCGGGGVMGTVTLIAPNQVLIARHCIPLTATGGLADPAQTVFRVRFRRSLTGQAENVLWAGGQLCHNIYTEVRIRQFIDSPGRNCDQVIGVLDAPVNHIRPIGLEFTLAPVASTDIVIAGWGYTGDCFGTEPSFELKYARGRSPANNALVDYFTYNACSLGSFAPCLVCSGNGPNAVGNLYDSGGPIFIEVPGQAGSPPELRLVATMTTPSTARRPSAWNNAGGTPRFAQSPSVPALPVADFNGDGDIELPDLFLYFHQYFAGGLSADLNNDGNIDIADIVIILQAYFAGR